MTKPIRESARLPGPDVSPLVHPLDVPEARPSFRRAMLLSVIASPAVVFLVGAVVWVLTHAALGTAGAAITVGVAGWMASRSASGQAWDYIPRRRQDRARPWPRGWQLAADVTHVTALVVGGGLIVIDLTRSAVPDAAVYALGNLAALVVLVGLEPGVRPWRPASLSTWVRAGTALLAAAAVWLVAGISVETVLTHLGLFALGAGVLAAVHVLWWASTRRGRARDSLE